MSTLLNHTIVDGLIQVFGDGWPEARDTFMCEFDHRIGKLVNDAPHSVESVAIEFHSIKGTGAAYGTQALSQLAEDAEQDARALPDPSQEYTDNATIRRLVNVWQQTKLELLNGH